MNRAIEIEGAAIAVLDYLDEMAQHADTPARREEAKKHATQVRWALTLAPPSVGQLAPTWREFVLWSDSDTDRPGLLRLDVRHVVSVREMERRRAYGATQPVAVIHLQDGAEFYVTDYQRDVAKLCRERDYEAKP